MIPLAQPQCKRMWRYHAHPCDCVTHATGCFSAFETCSLLLCRYSSARAAGAARNIKLLPPFKNHGNCAPTAVILMCKLQRKKSFDELPAAHPNSDRDLLDCSHKRSRLEKQDNTHTAAWLFAFVTSTLQTELHNQAFALHTESFKKWVDSVWFCIPSFAAGMMPAALRFEVLSEFNSETASGWLYMNSNKSERQFDHGLFACTFSHYT